MPDPQPDEEQADAPATNPPPQPDAWPPPRPKVIASTMEWCVRMWRMDHEGGTEDDAWADLGGILKAAIVHALGPAPE